MHWEKKICIRLTIRRIVLTILAASAVTNLVIVGVVFGADAPPAIPTATLVLPTPLSTNTFLIPISGAGEAPTLTQIPDTTLIDTFTPTLTSTNPPPWIVCIKRFYWPTYYVRSGDTLFSLASVIGTSVNELRSANCLANDQIHAGQQLYLPRVLSITIAPTLIDTPTATQTPTPTPTDTPTPTARATDTPTETPIPTPTDSPTPTSTAADTPTVFLKPNITFVLCSGEANYIYFNVIPSDPQGIRSVSVFYDINNGPKVEITMGPDGDTYYGSGTVLGQYSTRDTVNYFFRAVDNFGSTTDSTIFQSSPELCPLG